MLNDRDTGDNLNFRLHYLLQDVDLLRIRINSGLGNTFVHSSQSSFLTRQIEPWLTSTVDFASLEKSLSLIHTNFNDIPDQKLLTDETLDIPIVTKVMSMSHATNPIKNAAETDPPSRLAVISSIPKDLTPENRKRLAAEEEERQRLKKKNKFQKLVKNGFFKPNK